MAGIAESIEVPPALVQLLSVRDASRRLLALAVTFRILSTSTEDSQRLQQKIEKADVQVLEVCCVRVCVFICICVHNDACQACIFQGCTALLLMHE